MSPDVIGYRMASQTGTLMVLRLKIPGTFNDL